jgi:non-ribosomal peptide synthetase component F
MYAGGTVTTLQAGVVGRFDTSSDTLLAFEHSGGKLTIPYASIHTFQYSIEVTRHLGVLPAIAIGLVKMRQHRHYFRISYRDTEGAPQVAVFEVPKHMPRTLQAILEARVPKKTLPASCCGRKN